jgi:hypothetical protein
MPTTDWLGGRAGADILTSMALVESCRKDQSVRFSFLEKPPSANFFTPKN